jgi:hypothetical protein
MSFTTAAHHEPKELEYVSADDVLNVVTFRAPSKSQAHGAYNYASLDVVTGEAHCSCKGAETGRECWHITLLVAAFEAQPAVALARQYTGDQLVKAGTKSARMCRVYRARTWRVLPADAIALIACRYEFLRRKGVKVAASEAA